MTEDTRRPESEGTDSEWEHREALNALSFRTRVAVLWLAVAIALSGSLLLGVFVPGVLEELLAGEIQGQTLTDAVGYGLAMLVVIPLVMAVVTMLISDRVNRYVNLIAALAFGLFGVYAVVSEVLGGDFNTHVLMAAVAIVPAFLIAALALVGLRKSTDRRSLHTYGTLLLYLWVGWGKSERLNPPSSSVSRRPETRQPVLQYGVQSNRVCQRVCGLTPTGVEGTTEKPVGEAGEPSTPTQLPVFSEAEPPRIQYRHQDLLAHPERVRVPQSRPSHRSRTPRPRPPTATPRPKLTHRYSRRAPYVPLRAPGFKVEVDQREWISPCDALAKRCWSFEGEWDPVSPVNALSGAILDWEVECQRVAS